MKKLYRKGRKMSREQDRAKKKLEKNPIVECNKIQNKYYSDLFSRFVEVNDPRNQSYIDYTVKVMLGVLYYKCIGGRHASGRGTANRSSGCFLRYG